MKAFLRTITCLGVAVFAGCLRAAEIKVLSSVGVTAILDVLVPKYEQESGDRVTLVYDVTVALRKKIDVGEAFDLAILTRPAIDALVKEGKLFPASVVDIASSGIGVAVRRGAPRPDIGTVEAFKQAMLAAKTVTYPSQGASSIYVEELLKRLGISSMVKSKATLVQSDATDLVVKGEADIVVRPASELLPVAGLDYVGPLPPEIQSSILLTAGTSTKATQPAAAKKLIEYLSGPANAPILKAKGMDPG